MDSSQTDQSLNIADYLRPLWAHKLVILALVVVATAGTYAYYNSQPKVFSSSTDIYLRSALGADAVLTGTSFPVTSERELANQARLLKTRPVARRVAAKIGFKGNPESLLGAVTVAPSPDADFVTLTAVAGSGRTAADLANAFAVAFVDQRDAAQLANTRTSLTATQRSLDRIPKSEQESPAAVELQFRVRQLQALATLPSSTAAQLEEAQAPTEALSPHPSRNATFALALSLLFGAIAAYGLDRLDRRIRGVDDMRDSYDAPILAMLPRVKQMSAGAAKGRVAPPIEMIEMFRMLRSALDLSRSEDAPQVVLVTSAVSEEGKSTVARNLAIAHREAGRRVCLVEADLRRPSIANTLGLERSPGLSDVLAQRARLEDALQPVHVGVAGIEELEAAGANGNGSHAGALVVLTSGSRTPNPATLLAVPRLGAIVDQLRSTFDTVIIDSAPLLPVSDSLHLLPLVEGIVVVSRVGRSTHAGATRLGELLARYVHAPVLGVVANDVPEAPRGYGYSGYDYVHA